MLPSRNVPLHRVAASKLTTIIRLCSQKLTQAKSKTYLERKNITIWGNLLSPNPNTRYLQTKSIYTGVIIRVILIIISDWVIKWQRLVTSFYNTRGYKNIVSAEHRSLVTWLRLINANKLCKGTYEWYIFFQFSQQCIKFCNHIFFV